MFDKNIAKFIIVLLPLFALFIYAAKQTHLRAVEERRIQQTLNTIDHQLAQVRTVVPTVNKEYLRCMANNIYHEASGETFMGQVAVARVVMNRVKHGFASNPCRVIYQSHQVATDDESEGTRKVCQFSWVCEGKTSPKNMARYRQAEEIARRVLLEDAWRDVVPSNVLFFHNTAVEPGWNYRRVMTIGNHVFYSKDKK